MTTLIALVRTELAVERSAGGTAAVLAAFGIAGIVMIGISLDGDGPLLREVGPGVAWTLIVVLAALAALRSGYADAQPRHDLLRLLGVSPPVAFAARSVAAALVVAVCGVTTSLGATVLLDARLGPAPLQVTNIVLAAGALGALGVTARDLLDDGEGSPVAAALVVVPLAVPLAIAPVQAIDAVELGGSPIPWVAVSGLVASLTWAVGIASSGDIVRSRW